MPQYHLVCETLSGKIFKEADIEADSFKTALDKMFRSLTDEEKDLLHCINFDVITDAEF